MVTLNINMYVPVTPPPAPAEPQFVLNTQIQNGGQIPNNAQSLSTNPYGNTPSNSYLNNAYYFNDNTVISGEYNYIFVPAGKTIDLNNVYVFNNSSNAWVPFSLTSNWFTVQNITVYDSNNNQFSVVRVAYYDEDDEEWKQRTDEFSFNIN